MTLGEARCEHRDTSRELIRVSSENPPSVFGESCWHARRGPRPKKWAQQLAEDFAAVYLKWEMLGSRESIRFSEPGGLQPPPRG